MLFLDLDAKFDPLRIIQVCTRLPAQMRLAVFVLQGLRCPIAGADFQPAGFASPLGQVKNVNVSLPAQACNDVASCCATSFVAVAWMLSHQLLLHNVLLVTKHPWTQRRGASRRTEALSSCVSMCIACGCIWMLISWSQFFSNWHQCLAGAVSVIL